MAHYQNQYESGRTTYTDEYGNPVAGVAEAGGAPGGYGATGTRQPDQYGALHGATETDGAYGTTGGGLAATGHHEKGMKEKIMEKLPGGHSRKTESRMSTTTTTPGMKEKIMDKLPGGHSRTEGAHMSTTTPGQVAGGGYQKKGIMDKIKEKLPGGGHHDQY